MQRVNAMSGVLGSGDSHVDLIVGASSCAVSFLLLCIMCRHTMDPMGALRRLSGCIQEVSRMPTRMRKCRAKQ